jgi:hypothetical protein
MIMSLTLAPGSGVSFDLAGEVLTVSASGGGGVGSVSGWSFPVTEGATGDQAAAINSALATSGTNVVMLPPGVISVASGISIPSGKTLLGSGRGRTTIRAMTGFNKATVPLGGVVNIVDGVGNQITDLTVDVNKINNGAGSGLRVHGVAFERCQNFTVSRVDVLNATGYGLYHQGVAAQRGYNGWFYDCTARNCNVNFEVMGLIGGGFVDCYADRGAGDVGNEVLFHALNGTSQFHFVRCCGPRSSIGTGAGLSLVATAAMENIWITDCDIRTEGSYSALIADGGAAMAGLFTSGNNFVSTGQASTFFGANLSGWVSVGDRFAGYQVGVNLTNVPAHAARFEGCEVTGLPAGSGTVVYGIVTSNPCRFNGGRIKATATSSFAYGTSGPVLLSRETIVDATDHGVVSEGIVGGAAYTLQLKDADRIVEAWGNSTITVPPESSVPFPINTEITLLEGNPFIDIVVAAGSGVTVVGESMTLTGNNNSAILRKIGANRWLLRAT